MTFYFWKGDHGFRTAQLSYPNDYSKYRVTVDYPEDIEVVAFLMRTLRSRGQFGHLEEVTRILDEFPEIRAKNGQYYFGIGWQQS